MLEVLVVPDATALIAGFEVLATLTCEIASGIVISKMIVIATIICFFSFNFLNHPFLWRIYALNDFFKLFLLVTSSMMRFGRCQFFEDSWELHQLWEG